MRKIYVLYQMVLEGHFDQQKFENLLYQINLIVIENTKLSGTVDFDMIYFCCHLLRQLKPDDSIAIAENEKNMEAFKKRIEERIRLH